MNALTITTRLPPTAAEPIPTLAGTDGLKLLRSAPAATLSKMTEDLPTLKATALAICASLTPARPDEVAVVIEKLALHYPAISRNDREAVIANGDWLDDLAGYPADLIAEACRLWRNSTERFFPTPGQLKAKIEDIFRHRQALKARATELLLMAGDA